MPPQPNPAFAQAVEHQRRWGSPDVATQLGDVAAKTGQVAVSPISAVKGLYDKVEAADAATRNPSPSSDAYADPNAMAKDPDVPATALGLMGAGALGSQRNALGIFGGMQASTADLPALRSAIDMSAKGLSRDDIWNKTGWFQGADQQWRFEIPDAGAHASASGRSVMESGSPLTGKSYDQPLAGVLWHKPLYEAYPDLRKVTVDTNVPEGAHGVSRGGTIGIKKDLKFEQPTRSVLLHEVQHEVQRPEGFMVGDAPRGPTRSHIKAAETEYNYANDTNTLLHHARNIAGLENVEDLAKLPHDQFRALIPQAHEAFRTAMGRQPETGGYLHQVIHGADRGDSIKWVNENLDKYGDQVQKLTDAHTKAFKDYWNQASEVEARNVQKRMNMTPEQRQAAPPWTTEDVPRDQQIVQMLHALATVTPK